MEIELFSRKYLFPPMTDSQFQSLQSQIAQTRKMYEEGSTERKILFGFKKLPPRLTPEERLQLMELLVAHYQELIHLLKQKIDACRQAFHEIGDGVREMFQEKIRQIEEMEEQRKELVNRLRSEGKQGQADVMELHREQLRMMAQNLARASILIIRKLRHALDALSLLAEDEEAQKEVLRNLRNDVDTYRSILEYNRKLEYLQRDISEITRTALNFDDLLSKSLGPLSLLIEEISKTDRRVAESLAEIQRISLELENQSQIMNEFIVGDQILDLLVASHLKKDVLDSLIESITSPSNSLDEVEFELKLRQGSEKGPADFDFGIFARNITAIVDQGLSDLSGSTHKKRIPLKSPKETMFVEDTTAQKSHDPFASPWTGIPPSTALPEQSISEPQPASESHSNSQLLKPAMVPQTEPPPIGESQSNSAPQQPPTLPPQVESGLPPVREAPEEETKPQTDSGTRNDSPLEAKEDAPNFYITNLLKLKYRAAVSRANPTLVLFLLDMSGSMEETFQGKVTKAEFLARSVDRTLEELVVRCRKADGVRDYFHISCLGFGDGRVWSLLPLEEPILPISQLAQFPRSIQRDPGGLPHPSWVLPQAEGNTPLRAAFQEVCRIVGGWCDLHYASYPPTVILITDGKSTDGNPVEEARILKQLHTSDGETLLFCLHIATHTQGEILFPAELSPRLDEYGQFLFQISSPMPLHIFEQALRFGYPVKEGSRFFAYGAGPERIAHFFDLGTRPAQLL